MFCLLYIDDHTQILYQGGSDTASVSYLDLNIDNMCKSYLILELFNLHNMLFSYGATVYCMWVPSHINIHHNEMVDNLAKQAANGKGEQLHIVSTYLDVYKSIDKLFLNM